MRELLQIGEVAKLIGVSTKTIRYYHEIGLLAEPKRSEGGYRLYTAQDLLRLQRIRRLRSLGLPLDHIKKILGESDVEQEVMLRNALQSLVEELAAQIIELEERRELVKNLLVADINDQGQLPGEEPSTLYLQLVRDQLGAYLANISEESWRWSEKIDALLGTFHWPESYRETIKDVVQRIAKQPEQYKRLFALEERFAALAHEPEDSPEVERLAEDYARSGELGQLQSMFSTNNALGSRQLENTLMDLATTLVSPTQRRFFEELSRKLTSSESNDYQIKPSGQS
ncbi:MAG TPA: MerR family transcriptional regulator [Ktedonobacteraceae bacterium]